MLKIGKTHCSGSLTGTIDIKWIIEGFSTLDSDPGRAYTSENYHPHGSEKDCYYWYLVIYPGGQSHDSAGFVSLYLFYKHSHVDQFHTTWTVKIRNAEGEILCRGNLSYIFSSGYGNGFSKLTPRNELISKLQNDTIIINAKVNYSRSTIQNIDSLKLIQDDTSLHTKLHEDFKTLLEKHQTSDAVISVDGVDIPVHTTILSARSNVFAAMFQQHTIENTSRRVEIIDFEVDTVKLLLQFIYSASVDDMNLNLALDLLRAADKYDMCDLMEYCSNYLMVRIGDGNIMQILVAADMCNASRLREQAIEYFCSKNFEFDSKEYCSSFVQCPKLLLDIINRLKGI